MYFYSPFWASGGILTLSLWAAKDAQIAEATPYADLSLDRWAALSDAEHVAACRSLGFTPPANRVNLNQHTRARKAA